MKLSSKKAISGSLGDIARASTAFSEISKTKTWNSRSSHTLNEALRMKIAGNLDYTVTGILSQRFTKREESEIYSIKFSEEEEFVACGLGNSKIKLYSLRSNTLASTLETNTQASFPVTAIAFRPDHSSFKTKNVMAAAYADGKIRHWHYTSGKLISTIEENDNSINGLQYQNDGLKFVTAGTDMKLRVYDSVLMKSIITMDQGQGEFTTGHSNRIFCAKFHPIENDLIISGGWDNTLQIWDQRVGKAVRSIFGPHLCGESLDISDDGNQILTGSYSKKDPLQIWDWRTGNILKSIPWSNSEGDTRSSCLIYSASYSKGTMSTAGPCNNRFIIAGGTNQNEIRIYTSDSHRAVGSILGLPDAVFSVAMSPKDRYFALGGGGTSLMVFNVEERLND